MIKVNIYKNDKNNIIGFTANGHANANIKGKDIVCAGVSSILQSSLLGLNRHLKCNLYYKQSNTGYLKVKLLDYPTDLTETIFKTMLLGLFEISKIYPNNLKIEIK